MRTFLDRLRRAPIVRRLPGRLILASLLAALLLVRGRTVTLDCISAFATPAMAETAAMAGMPLMNWFANHPARGEQSLATPVDSFTVNNFFFDRNGSSASVVDTAKIVTGDAILWKWVTGSHTITNGTGGSDPNAGVLFDQPSSTSNRRFTFQFNTIGTYPFFCRFHEGSNMRGIVVVSQNTTGVGPPATAGGEGFVRAPWPNPTRGTTTFRYALSRAGHVRLSILDALGRRVATPLDGDLGAGTFESRWSGRTADGATARAGVYFARIELPGRTQTQRVALIR